MDLWLKKKYIAPEELGPFSSRLKREKKTLATLNGSFDLLHAGHLFILQEAKSQADLLLVALNSDASIQRYKSPNRPIVSLPHRLALVAAIQWVDFVTFFEEDDPRAFLEVVRPNVHVNGAEYGENCIEAETVKNVGARLHLVRRIPSLSTTEILDKVRTCV